MQKYYKFAIIFIILAAISACSSLEFPWAYKVNIPQGNYIEHEMVEQLKVGMSKRQVRYVMGSPLVEDTFNTDRWDYYFSVRKGNKMLKEQHFTVHFEDEKLTRWEGTYEPARKNQAKKTAKKPESESTPETDNNEEKQPEPAEEKELETPDETHSEP